MIRVSTAVPKSRLGSYLALVQSGETSEVTSHRHVVARVVGASADVEKLVQAPSRPLADLQRLRGVKPRLEVDAVAALLDDRSRR